MFEFLFHLVVDLLLFAADRHQNRVAIDDLLDVLLSSTDVDRDVQRHLVWGLRDCRTGELQCHVEDRDGAVEVRRGCFEFVEVLSTAVSLDCAFDDALGFVVLSRGRADRENEGGEQ